ncbi:RcnB family protein [Qipengyuania sp. YIM B01966]|uniref:RcnB family protein n=1 Tax=Qipengyuania sp. YIM B01966 TaxID=2778646 RepID=UPI0018F581F7|nr:RcnB family protein [Qipengyuania sp. YIM B01966]
MRLTHLFRTASAGVLGASLLLALPAQAQDASEASHDAEPSYSRAQSDRRGAARPARPSMPDRVQQREMRGPQPVQDVSARPAPVSQARGGPSWNRSDNRSPVADQRAGRDWNRGNARRPDGWRPGDDGVRRQQEEIDRRLRQGGVDRNDPTTGRRDRDRDGTHWTDQGRDWRNGGTTWSSDGRYRDRDGRWRDNRDDNRYDGRYGDRYGRYDPWDRYGWRRDNRYNWYDYRRSNRSIFSIGRYYAPFGSYRYSRIGLGFTLGSAYYGNRYWINDPWRYRLPEVYGPYRWVRYYDDVLLVDIYSGRVVDVIHDFFW